MASNAKPGHGRLGPIKNRIQSLDPRTHHWVKRSTKTGRIVGIKANKQPFKSVRKHK